jgi:hypothetical protein
MASEKTLRRRDFLVASGAGVGAAKAAKLTAQSPIAVEKSSRISLFPLDARCALLSNVLWTADARGGRTLRRQYMWDQFPAASPFLESGFCQRRNSAS